MSKDVIKTWSDITSDSSWVATENCYLVFTSISNDSNGHAYVTVNETSVAGCINGSVSTGWVFRNAHRILLAKGDVVNFKVTGGKNIITNTTAYKIEWK